MTIPVYNTGTVSVAANGTDVSNGGTAIWSNGNVKEGDWIVIDGEALTMVIAVVDTEHITIPEWQGGARTNVEYAIYQNYSARDDSTAIAKDVGTLVAALNKEGFIWFVGPNETGPDPSRGDDGQWAYQPSSGKQWHKEGGEWVPDGIFKPFGVPAPYDNGKTYSLNNVATSGGSSYVFINATPSAGHAPPNATYWAVLAAKGDQGIQGVQGKGYAATSGSSFTISAGTKNIVTQTGLAYVTGSRVRVAYALNNTNWVEGICSYDTSTGNMSIEVDKFNGSATLNNWAISIAGQPGAGDLSSANNLSDLANASAARANLGLGNAATSNVGTTAGTVAAGDDARFSRAMGGYFAYTNAGVATLSPRDGDAIKINGAIHQIPSAGVTLANSGLTGSTFYYVYAYMNGSVMTLEASSTAPASSATAGNVGVQIKTGDNTRSLVGALWTNASVNFTANCTMSWFNKRNRGITTTYTTQTGTLATTDFVSWGDEAVFLSAGGFGFNTAASTNYLQLVIDSNLVGSQSAGDIAPGTINRAPTSVFFVTTLATGAHKFNALVSSNAGTNSWTGAITLNFRG